MEDRKVKTNTVQLWF